MYRNKSYSKAGCSLFENIRGGGKEIIPTLNQRKTDWFDAEKPDGMRVISFGLAAEGRLPGFTSVFVSILSRQLLNLQRQHFMLSGRKTS